MALYFFDLEDGDCLCLADESVECATTDEMHLAAITFLPAVAVDCISDQSDRHLAVKVRDESGRYVYQAAMEFHAGPIG